MVDSNTPQKGIGRIKLEQFKLEDDRVTSLIRGTLIENGYDVDTVPMKRDGLFQGVVLTVYGRIHDELCMR